jgi:hypothetical protein
VGVGIHRNLPLQRQRRYPVQRLDGRLDPPERRGTRWGRRRAGRGSRGVTRHGTWKRAGSDAHDDAARFRGVAFFTGATSDASAIFATAAFAAAFFAGALRLTGAAFAGAA